MSDIKYFSFDNDFITESGDCIPSPTLAYQTWGELNGDKTNAILICHALTGNADAADWFSGLFDERSFIDLEEHYVICINHPGSCYGSVGPTSVNPETGKIYKADFPELTIRDIVRLEQGLLDELDIQEIELIIGGSMGGMIALEFCVMDDRIQSACLIATSKSHSAWAIGISEAQRIAIKADRNWNDGYYTDDRFPSDGLTAARSMAMITYRSPQNYDQKFARNWNIQKNKFEVESYLKYQGEKLVNRFDANSYIILSKAMDTHDIARGRGTAKTVLSRIQIPVLIIGIDSDILYPIKEQIELAELIPGSTFKEIKSKFGHDGFLIEFKQMNYLISNFLNQEKLPINTI